MGDPKEMMDAGRLPARAPALTMRCVNEAAPASICICVDSDDPALRARGEALARTLQLPLVDCHETTPELLLALTADRLELRSTRRGDPGAVYAEFVGGAIGFARKAGGTRLLYQAIGVRGQAPSVFDATAGLGRDAFLLAAKGCRVTAVERSPIVAALLEDGLARAALVLELRETVQRVCVVVGDAREILRKMAPSDAPDVIYLDPMFPPKRKTALVKKEMRMLRRVVGDDPDATELFELARTIARRHVVVKRMRLAPAIAPGPTRTYEGKSTRYDVYGRSEK